MKSAHLKRLGVIACGVFEWNLRRVAEQSENEIHFELLPAGLHANPTLLREKLQAAIDHMDAELQPDGIVLGFGLCGRGTARIAARNVPLAIPRAEDCTAVFLGSQRRYHEEFARRPGTYYHSIGWAQSRGQGAFGTDRNRSLYDPKLKALQHKYGHENAEFIVAFRQSWRGNYQRAAYIDYPDEPDRDHRTAKVRALADAQGWEYEELRGSEDLFRALVDGEWDHPDIVVIRPGEVIVPAPGAEVLGAGLDATAAYLRELAAFRRDAPAGEGRRRGIGLGIDAGGTFTDSVIYDIEAGEVLDKAKAPTTHEDLIQGIAESVAQLDADRLRRVERVALSTTLATNAIVEGRGQRVGVLAMGIDERDLGGLDFELKARLPGRMSIEGHEREPVDLDAVRKTAREMADAGARAFAVSGYAAVINPAHEIAVADAVRETTDMPVVCGHELTRRLNIFHRANTAGLNARLLPLIQDLIRSVRRVLADYGIENVRMMVVRGDGSQLLDACAERLPVETILSGPAASVVGAVTLSGRGDALVADMGGTTLDVAVVKGGEPVIAPAGATVGGFNTSVEAMRIHTVGLGCDSEIHFDAWPAIGVGPRRRLPLCVLAARYDGIAEHLESLAPEDIETLDGTERATFLLRRSREEPPDLSEREHAVLAALEGGPLTQQALAERLGVSPFFVPVPRLEKLGLVLRAGLTPTDLLHIEGRFSRFNADAARAAFELYAARLGVTDHELADRIRRTVTRTLVRELLRADLADTPWDADGASAAFLIERLLTPPDAGTRFALQLDRPVVPVGAPAHAFFPELGAALGTPVVLPEHAEVANAVGAIAGRVALSEQVELATAADGAFQVQSRFAMKRFGKFSQALAEAEAVIRRSLSEQAEQNDVAFHDPEFTALEHTALTNRGPLFLGATLQGRLLV